MRERGWVVVASASVNRRRLQMEERDAGNRCRRWLKSLVQLRRSSSSSSLLSWVSCLKRFLDKNLNKQKHTHTHTKDVVSDCDVIDPWPSIRSSCRSK
jgi:hypothetical protein